MTRLNNWIESYATKALSIAEDDKSELKEYFDNKTQTDIYKILNVSI